MGRITRSASVLVAALALAGCWAVPGQNPDRTAHNAFESSLTPATVGELTQAWQSDFGFGIPLAASDPVVSSDGRARGPWRMRRLHVRSCRRRVAVAGQRRVAVLRDG